jgi:hypothetical protein
MMNFKTNKTVDVPNGPLQLGMISSDDMSDVKKISDEVCKLFNDRVEWITRVGNKMEIKPADSPVAPVSKPGILVRHTVFRKTDRGWEKVHVADIITSPDQQVVFKDDRNDGYLWTHQAGDNVIALEGQMTLKVEGEKIDLDYSGGQATGTPVMLKNIRNSNSEYVVFQTVNRI